MWFLMSTASNRPMRWLVPPPTRASAYFLRQAQAGRVLRVSTMWALALKPRHPRRSRVLWPRPRASAKVERRAFGAEQGAGAALHLQHHLVCGAALALPHKPGDAGGGSSARSAAVAQRAPQITALSRASTRARTRRAGQSGRLVRSPLPRSSCRARATSSRTWGSIEGRWVGKRSWDAKQRLRLDSPLPWTEDGTMTDTTTPSSASAGTPYGTLPPASPLPQRRPVSLRRACSKAVARKSPCSPPTTPLLPLWPDAAGVECLLVGDSLGMVCQGCPAPWASSGDHGLPHRQRGAGPAPCRVRPG